MNERKIVSIYEVTNLINSMAISANFFISYDRVVPKCSTCGAKKTKRWVDGTKICPVCGGEVCYDNYAQALKTVNTGFEKGCYRYFDLKANDFRHCRLDKIKFIQFETTEYFVVQTV